MKKVCGTIHGRIGKCRLFDKIMMRACDEIEKYDFEREEISC